MNLAPARAEITLVVAADQATVREALVVMLDLAPDVHVVAGVADGEAAVRAVEEHRPAVVLMDLNMPVLGGVGATERIRAGGSGTAVLVLTAFDDDESILAALQAGASGYLTKDAARAPLLNAVRTAAPGQPVLAPEVQRRLLNLATRSARRPRDDFGLTAREREILGLIGEGLRNPEIAARLVISEATVKTHINNMFAKAGFRTRADAVRYALRDPG